MIAEKEKFKTGYSDGNILGHNDAYFGLPFKDIQRRELNMKDDDPQYQDGFNCGYRDGYEEGDQI